MSTQNPVGRAKIAFDSHRFQAALWWASEALSHHPDSEDAKRVFVEAFVLASLALPTVVSENQKILPQMTQLMERGNMSLEEAEFVAEGMISVYFAEELGSHIHPLLDRYNSEESFRTATKLTQGDLGSAKLMAAALADLASPSARSDRGWRFRAEMTKSFVAEMKSAFEIDRKALIIMLQASMPKDWAPTCQALHLLYLGATRDNTLSKKAIEDYELLGERFRPAADDMDIDDKSLRRYRDGFAIRFAKNAAHIKWLLCIAREPK